MIEDAAHCLLQLAAKRLQLAKQIGLLPWLLRIFILIVLIAHRIPSLADNLGMARSTRRRLPLPL
jgi:hypothetical protein